MTILNKFEEIKRNNYIRKLRSNAIAIKTKQIEIHEGSWKMEYLYNRINEIKYLEELDLEIFEKFNLATNFYPIGSVRNKFNKDYLQKLDGELEIIDQEFTTEIFAKCDEIITKMTC